MNKVIKGKPTCKKCGFRIRGKIENHESGVHHKHGKNLIDRNGKHWPVRFG